MLRTYLYEDDAYELFMKGINCYSSQNYTGAVEFFKKAARLGNAEARDILKSSNIPW